MYINFISCLVSFYSFALGAIPFGFLMGKLRNVDIKKEGSGNIGATNVWRILGPKYGVIVFLLDGLKGVLAVCITSVVGPGYIPLAMFMAVLGHIFSPFLGFKGGKGVATFCFTLLLLDPKRAMLFAYVWCIVFAFTRYVSLASIIGMCSVIVSASCGVLISGGNCTNEQLFIAEILLALLSIFMHRSNITRLLSGREPQMRSEAPLGRPSYKSTKRTNRKGRL